MRKPSRKTLVRRLDSVHSTYIRNRDKRCVTCGATTDLTNGHLFSRSSYSTRWSDLNCHGQCRSCNFRHEYDSGPFTLFFIREFGTEAYDELHREYVTPRKFKDCQLQEMISKYEGMLGEV